MKLHRISEIVRGTLRGDPDIEIEGVSGIKDARAGDITFLKDTKLLKDLENSSASAVLIGEEIRDLEIAQVIVPNPFLSFTGLLELFYVSPRKVKGVMNGSFISENVRLGRDISIYPMVYLSRDVVVGDRTTVSPFVSIGRNSRIGDDCIIHPHVTIGENISIGNRVIIHPGTVIGSDGYGYIFVEDRHHKIPQIGGVIIEDDVEIGSNVSIDRATTGNTVIGAGAKIDNLVQIAHNVTIGKHSLIVAQTGIAGSSSIGDYVTLAGQVGVSDHAHIDSGSIVGAKSGVMGTIKKGKYFGSPIAIPHREFLKAHSLFTRLPEMNKKIKDLEERIRLLTGSEREEKKRT